MANWKSRRMSKILIRKKYSVFITDLLKKQIEIVFDYRGGARKISKCSITALQYNFPLYNI